MGRQARPQARSDWTSTRGSQRILTPAPVTHTALKPRGRRSQIGLRQEVRNEQGNEGERAPTAATGDRRRVKSPRIRQRWGAKLALGPEVTGWHQQIRLGVLLLGKVAAPAIPTEDHLRSTTSTPSWPSWPQRFRHICVVHFTEGEARPFGDLHTHQLNVHLSRVKVLIL